MAGFLDKLTTAEAELLAASRVREDELRAQRQRRRRAVTAGFGIAAVVALLLAVAALIARNDAQDQTDLADASRLATASINVLGDDPELALMLAVASAERGGEMSFEQRRALHAAIDRTKSVGRIEHTYVTAWTTLGWPSPDGTRLAYIGYTSRGYDLYVLSLDPGDARPARDYVDDRPPPSEADALLPSSSKRYVAARTLYPRFWGVDLEEDGFGQQLGIFTRGNDAAEFHDFFARLGISLTEGHVNVDLRYTLRRMPPDLSVSFFRRVTPRGGFVVNGRRQPYVEDAYGGRFALSQFIPRSFHSNTVSASYGVTWTRSLSRYTGPISPNFPPPTIPVTGLNADMRFSWGTATCVGTSTTTTRLRVARSAPR